MSLPQDGRGEQLDAAWDDLLDDEDQVVGRVKDVKAVEKRLRHRLLPLTIGAFL